MNTTMKITAIILVTAWSAIAGPSGAGDKYFSAYGPYQSLINDDILATNGLECSVNISSEATAYDYGHRSFRPPVCTVEVINNVTNDFACLAMPITNVCKIALIDDRKQEVEKTDFGKMFGASLSDSYIDEWRQQWMQSQPKGDSHQSIFIKISGGNARYPVMLGQFSIKDAFKMTRPGEYELHLQLRLVQSVKDPSGTFHYPVSILPETVEKVHVDTKEF